MSNKDNYDEYEDDVLNPPLSSYLVGLNDRVVQQEMEKIEHERGQLTNEVHRLQQELLDQYRKHESQSERKDESQSQREQTVNTDGAISNISAVLSKLADAISITSSTKGNHDGGLPRKEPPVFKGDILEYPSWKNSYELLVEERYPKTIDRIYYLGRYTAGEAKEAVKGLLLLNSDISYAKAKHVLEERYGNKLRLARLFRQKIAEWPRMTYVDGKALTELSDFLVQCETGMITLSQLRILDDPEEYNKIIEKLPRVIQAKWLATVDQWMFGDALDLDSPLPMPVNEGYPPFSYLCKFIAREARMASNPVAQRLNSHASSTTVSKPRDNFKNSNPRSFNTGPKSSVSFASASGGTPLHSSVVNSGARPREVKCYFCEEPHYLDGCDKFKRLTLAERHDFVKKRGLCRACLRWGHMRRDCKRRRTCEVCKGSHPSILHDYSRAVDSGVVANAIVHCVDNLVDCEHDFSHSLIVPVILHHEGDPSDNQIVYALLDDQSDACFITESTLNQFGCATGIPTRLKLATVMGESTIDCQRANGLVIKGLHEATDIALPTVFTRAEIPAKRGQIPRPSTVRNWPHLKEVTGHLTPYLKDVEIGLLIGINCARAIKPLEVVPGNGNEPYAVKTALGWGVIGMMCPSSLNPTNEPSFSASTQVRFVFRTTAKEVIPADVNRMFEMEFSERPTLDEKESVDDRKFIDQLQQAIHKTDDGHFEMPLPFREETRLPNNRAMVTKRLNSLKARMLKDKQLKDDYTGFMRDLIRKGHAERVPDQELERSDGHLWYIPHHGVYHPRKPGKIRVVFDCSALYEGESLNKRLLQGPNLTNNLTGILCRFRKGQIAVTCDIEACYHQVKVNKEQRDYLRFLWWPDGNLDKPAQEFRMTVHLFGATSSPGCANFALKAAAMDGKEEHGEAAAKFVRDEFYVDDGVTSVNTIQEGINLVHTSRLLCQENGFRLHKFLSNNKAVLDSIPQSERAKDIQNIDIFKDDLPTERTLGMQWSAEEDEFQFSVQPKPKLATRRGILSTVSSVFDPLGLISPFILRGKRILQDLCIGGLGWDDPVPEDSMMKWQGWTKELPSLSKIHIPRCFTSSEMGAYRTVELHNFSDASLVGYGCASYLRVVDENERIETSLVMSKSRVTPIRPITVPRLELTAAVASINLSKFIERELQLENLKQFYYTDSKVVLGYISNESRRFHIYVANRVQQIREHSSPGQWRHVDTHENPADWSSRGMTADELSSSRLWWKGPEFLSTKDGIPLPAEPTELAPDDPEVKRTVCLKTEVESHPDDILDRFSRFSSWYRLRRAVALCRKYIQKLRDHDRTPYTAVDVKDLEQAENVIIRLVQRKAYSSEVATLKNQGQRVTSKSNLYPLDPFLDGNSILRVGGRLKRAKFLSEDLKHPVLLPQKSHVSCLIIAHYHRASGHPGRGMTLNGIRKAGYWIIRARTAVTVYIRGCVICRKLRGMPCLQKMADLPVDRLEEAAPFTYCGVDLFGPFYIKEKRSVLKRWGVLYTCLASRAVHIETANSMDTDSFLNSYRRFVCRRGPIRLLRCDRGTNFIGGKSELEAALAEMDKDKIKQEMLKDGCDLINFQTNFPKSSHANGVTERMIGAARRALEGLLTNVGSQLDDELLRTLMVEVEAIVNSRPLTYDEAHTPDDPVPISPSNILTLKSRVVLPPPGNFVKQDLYCRRRWRRVQFLANQFWERWKSEFLPTLQFRSKWQNPKCNLRVDDVVLIIDEDLARSQWSLGRVIETYPSQDGFVRKVKLKTGKGQLERPIDKLVLLVEREFPDEEPERA